MARRWVVILLGLATAVFVFVMMDRLKSYNPIDDDGAAVSMPAGVPSPKEARVFVLMIDSLRYETAMNPAIMPNLAQLRTEGVSAQVDNIVTAVTRPSLFTIFTGREDVSLLGFLRNFIDPKSVTVESLFDQLAREGVASAVCSGTHFVQFGQAIGSYQFWDVRAPPASYEQKLLEMADRLGRGECGLAVGHVLETDHAGHKYGVHRPEYRAVFREVDALIPQLRARLPTGATLVVMGDHGHTEDGNHSLSFGLPTAAVYAGPPFRRGFDLGTIKLATNRYLLGAAFGLPLRTYGYAGDFCPEAVVPRGRTVVTGDGGRPAPTNEAERWDVRLGWLSLGFGVLFALWLNVALPEWSPLDFSGWRLALAAVPLGACFLPLGWVGPVASVTGGIIMMWAGRGAVSRAKRLRWTLGFAAMACALPAWGWLLGKTLMAQRTVTPRDLMMAWLAAGAAGVILATRANRTKLAWLWLVAPGLLLLPSNAHYGWIGAWVPVLFCWFAFYVGSIFRERRRLRQPFDRGEMAWLIGVVALVFVLLQAQFSSDAIDYIFNTWRPLIPGWGPENFIYMTVVGTMASAVIFCDQPRRADSRLVAVGLAVLLYPLQWRLWPLSPGGWIGVLAAGTAAWLVARRCESRHSRALGLWLGLATWCYLIRPPVPNQAAVCCMLAALGLATRLMRRHPQPENARADHVFLAVLGIATVGYALCRWSVQDLEWRAAYDWFEPAQVERFAVVVLIGFIAKGFLPWRAMRRAIGVGSTTRESAVGPHVRAAVVVKCMSVILIMTGLGFATEVVGAYIEAAQQAVVLGILALYVLT